VALLLEVRIESAPRKAVAGALTSDEEMIS